jgi:hypothetical protein
MNNYARAPKVFAHGKFARVISWPSPDSKRSRSSSAVRPPQRDTMMAAWKNVDHNEMCFNLDLIRIHNL